MEPIVLFFKGGKAGGAGLFRKRVTDKRGVSRDQWVKLPAGSKAAHNDRQGEFFDVSGTPYESIETRSGTTDKQRQVGADAFTALKRRVDLLRDRGGPAATLLGSRLCAGFVANGGNQLVGQRASTAGDLAAIAQVYRDPRFETFRVIYLKGDEVVGEAAYSSRLPGAVRLPGSMPELIEADKIKFGSDGYHLVHNHPSGRANASSADEQLTKWLAVNATGMREHVIIDHNEYGVITNQGISSVHREPALAGVDYHANPAMAHPLLGSLLGSPKDVALASKALQAENHSGAPILIMTTGQHAEVSLVASVSTELLDSLPAKNARVKAWLRGVGRASGAGAHRFLLLSNADYSKHTKACAEMVRDGLLTDVLSADGESIRDVASPAKKDVFAPLGAGRMVAEPSNLPGNYPDSLAVAVTGTNVSTLYKAGLLPGEELVPLNSAMDKKPQMVSPAYRAAKKDGNGVAAYSVVIAAIRQKTINEIRAKLIPGVPVVFVPVTHKDQGASGNMIPRAYAVALSEIIPGEVEQDIVKTSGRANTGASLDDRANNQQAFDGKVRPGVQYVVVDDTFTSGSTVSALTAHIQSHGGIVSAITALAAGKYQNYLKHRPQDVEKMLAKLGLSKVAFEHETRIPIDALTGSEIYRLANLDGDRCSLDTIRKRFSKRSGIPPGGSPSRGFGNQSSHESESAGAGSPQVTPPLHKTLPHGSINNGAELCAQSYSKGGAMLAIPEKTRILFFKSQIAAYTRKDGVTVAAHSDKRTKKSVAKKDGRTPDLFSQPKPSHSPALSDASFESWKIGDSLYLNNPSGASRGAMGVHGEKGRLESIPHAGTCVVAFDSGKKLIVPINLLQKTPVKPEPKPSDKPVTRRVKVPGERSDMAKKDEGFDSEKFDRERNAKIKTSRDSGAIHLDRLQMSVESMRGKKISYVHGDEKGIVTTVSNGGAIYVMWDTGPMAGNESFITNRDAKDYVVTNPHEQYDAASFAKQRRKWDKQAASAKADEGLEKYIKVAADSVGELRKIDVMRVLESNFTRNKELARYIARKRPDLAREVKEVMEDEFDIKDWMAKSIEPRILFLKSHVKQFTRADGTIVKEHDDKRQKKMAPPPVGRKPGAPEDQGSQHEGAAQEPSKYGHHNVDAGDSLRFSAGSFKGGGKVKSAGKDGAVVTDESGRDHNVHWSEVTGRGGDKPKAEGPQKPDYAPRNEGEADKAYAKRVIDKGDAVTDLPEDHDKYFNTEGATHVPMENLHSTKSDEENQQGGDNGPKRMQAAYHGVLGKRDPITVMPHKEKAGHFEVVDGNGTMTSGKNLGWKSLPTKVVSREDGQKMIDAEHAKDAAKSIAEEEENLKKMEGAVNEGVQDSGMHDFFAKESESLPRDTYSKFTSWEDLDAASQFAQDELVALLAKAGDALGGESVEFGTYDYAKPGIIYGVGPIKTKDSATRKVSKPKYKGDWSRLGDLVRGSVGFDSVEEMKDGIEKLKAAGLKLATKADNKFAKPTEAGYRDMNLNILLSNGVVGELQLHLKPVLDAKNKGHKYYEESRLLEGEVKGIESEAKEPSADYDGAKKKKVERYYELMRAQRKLYGNSMAKALGKADAMIKAFQGKMIVLFKRRAK